MNLTVGSPANAELMEKAIQGRSLWEDARRRLLRNRAAVAGMIVLGVLVVAADQPDVQAPARLRDGLTAAGGRVAGVFFNRAEVETPGFLRAFLR